MHEQPSTSDYEVTAFSEPLVPNDTEFTFGGVSINEPLGEINLFGPSRATFALTPPLNVTKFTKFAVTMKSVSVPEMVRVCLLGGIQNFIGESSCINLKQGENILAIGEDIFEHKISQATHLIFEQINSDPREGETNLKTIYTQQLAVPPLIDSDGNCSDENAIKSTNLTCVCKLGYVSSNGGTVLDELDTCVPCTRPYLCGFDADTCERDQDCLLGWCSSGYCLFSVSSFLAI